MSGNPIKFETLSMRNFLSYGNNTTVINFDSKGTTLIIGEDLDNTTGGQGANGVGKTVILNAVTYALYDKPISNISKDNLVNNINKKNMIVSLEFTKAGKRYRIERARKTKEGSYVKLEEDGVDVTRDSVANTNAYIERVVNIPYDLFVLIVVFSASRIPFLDLSTSDQVNMMEHLFSFVEISEKAEKLKEWMKEVAQHLKEEEIRINMLKSEHERFEKQIQTTNQRIQSWESDREVQLSALKHERDELINLNFDEEVELHKKIQTYNDELKRIDNERSSKERELTTYQREMKKITEELAHLQDHQCPFCLQHYQDANAKIDEKNNDKQLLDQGIQLLSSDVDNLNSMREVCVAEMNSLKSNIKTKSLDEAMKLQVKIGQIDQKIDSLQNGTNPYIESLNDMMTVKLDPISYEKINELNKVTEHQKFLYKLLTKKDSFIRKIILDKNLPFLNGRLQEYLTELGLPHKVEFTPELSVKISSFGREMDFGNLSNGQRARVNISLSLAFRDILQKMHDPVNICMFDEVLDVGLDGVGVVAAAKLIKKKAKQEDLCVYVISHRDEVENMFDRNMTIQMSQGFSYVKQ